VAAPLLAAAAACSTTRHSTARPQHNGRQSKPTNALAPLIATPARSAVACCQQMKRSLSPKALLHNPPVTVNPTPAHTLGSQRHAQSWMHWCVEMPCVETCVETCSQLYRTRTTTTLHARYTTMQPQPPNKQHHTHYVSRCTKVDFTGLLMCHCPGERQSRPQRHMNTTNGINLVTTNSTTKHRRPPTTAPLNTAAHPQPRRASPLMRACHD
jgi:hypothetical protein